MVEESLKIRQLQGNPFETYASGAGAENGIVEAERRARVEGRLSFLLSRGLSRAIGKPIADTHIGKAEPMVQNQLEAHLERVPGPQGGDRPLVVRYLTLQTQGRYRQAHAQAKEQPLAQEPQEQREAQERQRPALIEQSNG